MSKNSISFTRLGGKRKGGRPIVNKYTIGQSQSSHAILFLKIFVVVALIGLLYYLHKSQIVVWFNRSLITENTLIAVDLNFVQSEISHYLFSILNSFLLGVYLSAVLPISGKRSWKITTVLIIATILLAVLSLGYVGIYLFMNFPFFAEKTYISNQNEGLVFFIGNLPFFLLLYAISLIIESETD